MSEKIFCGSGRIIKTQYGDLPKVTFHKDNVNTIVKWMKENDSDFIQLVMKEKREKVDGKPTHYLEVDEWKPSKEPEAEPKNESEGDDGDDSLPF